jgi:predicted CopG family antitoxin
MMHELTITIDDNVYQVLKPMVEQETINVFHAMECRKAYLALLYY